MRTPYKSHQCQDCLPVICILWYCTAGKSCQYSSGSLHVFHFWSTHQSALAFWKADVRNRIPDILPLLQTQSAVPRQMQDAIGFSHRLCSITFPLYDNRMCGIFQCVQAIFPIENTGQDAVIIHVTIHMHWIFHQNGISCRNGCEIWDYILHHKTWFGICRQKRNKNVCNYEKASQSQPHMSATLMCIQYRTFRQLCQI